METPQRVGMNAEAVLARIKALQPVYLPQWKPAASEPGWAVAQLFAGMAEGLDRRLDQLPEKLFIAYLERLGYRLNPPLAARVPVTFALTRKFSGATTIAAGTQVATQEKIAFETERAFTAMSARLNALVAADPVAGRVRDHSTALQEGAPMHCFADAPEEQYLYFGDDALFNIHREVSDPNAGLEFTVPELANRGWQYLGREASEETPHWIDFHVSDANVLNKRGTTYTSVKGVVNGIESYWIRVRTAPETRRLSAYGVTFRSRSSTDALYHNTTPLDPDRGTPRRYEPFYPFGRMPQLNDCFYIASGEAFSKKGFTISLEIDNGSPALDGSLLSWEYFNGTSWKPLGAKPLPRRTGYGFTVPRDLAPTRVSGEENHWIRAKLLDNSPYATYSCDGGALNPTFEPPQIDHMEIYVEPRSVQPQHLFRYAHGSFDSLPAEAGGDRTYLELDETHQCLYLGFDRPFEAGLVSMYAALSTAEASQRRTLRWSYFGSDGWRPLSVEEGTGALSQSGIWAFVAPSDQAPLEAFGMQRYWLRAELSASGSAVEIGAIHMNSVMARQSKSVEAALLGGSDGTPSQRFATGDTSPMELKLWVREALLPAGCDGCEAASEGGYWVPWNVVDSLEGTAHDARVYRCEEGEVLFGDGKEGMIPPILDANVRVSYRSGGGSSGNVPAGAIEKPVNSIAYVDGVKNPVEASGGADAQAMETLMRLAPKRLRHGYRGVGAEDYRYLAMEASSDVARVAVIPGRGRVALHIVPESTQPRPLPSTGLIARVQAYLDARAPLTAVVTVAGPKYAAVSIAASLTVEPWDVAATMGQTLEAALEAFLHPLTGGMAGQGWAFGTLPTLSDFYRLISALEGVTRVDDLTVTVETEEGRFVYGIGSAPPRPLDASVLICNGEHAITIRGA